MELSRAFEGYLPGEEGGGAATAMELHRQQKQHRTGLYRASHACCHGQFEIRGEIKGCDRSKGKWYLLRGAHNEGNGKSCFFYF